MKGKKGRYQGCWVTKWFMVEGAPLQESDKIYMQVVVAILSLDLTR